jgi:hypothetical protein
MLHMLLCCVLMLYLGLLCADGACAPFVLQRAWRACLQKRASRALAMMVLRAKVSAECHLDVHLCMGLTQYLNTSNWLDC